MTLRLKRNDEPTDAIGLLLTIAFDLKEFLSLFTFD